MSESKAAWQRLLEDGRFVGGDAERSTMGITRRGQIVSIDIRGNTLVITLRGVQSRVYQGSWQEVDGKDAGPWRFPFTVAGGEEVLPIPTDIGEGRVAFKVTDYVVILFPAANK